MMMTGVRPVLTAVSRLLPAFCLALSASLASGQTSTGAAADVAAPSLSRVQPLDVTEIAEGVFVHVGDIAVFTPGNLGDIVNTGFIVGDDAVAVIDAGGSRKVGQQLLASVRKQTDLPVRWIILTHMHPDHTLGATVFQQAGATVIGHAKLPRALAARRGSYLASGARLMGDGFGGTEVAIPDETVDRRRELDLGGRVLVLEAHATAHTDNDLTVLDRKTGTLWLSDLLFIDHAPALDGDLRGWIALLEELSTQPVARVVPGHGPASADWPEAGHALLRYLKLIRDETRTAINAGVPLSRAVERVGRSEIDNWRLFDEFNARNATAAYTELEWE